MTVMHVAKTADKGHVDALAAVRCSTSYMQATTCQRNGSPWQCFRIRSSSALYTPNQAWREPAHCLDIPLTDVAACCNVETSACSMLKGHCRTAARRSRAAVALWCAVAPPPITVMWAARSCSSPCTPLQAWRSATCMFIEKCAFVAAQLNPVTLQGEDVHSPGVNVDGSSVAAGSSDPCHAIPKMP